MAERPEDLNLPNAVVTRIIKESLPDGINVAKEARAAIARAASVFILYSTTCANNVAIKSNRKTITGQDVIQAMTDMEFEKFAEPLKQYLEGFKKGLKDKKEATAKRLKEKEQSAPADEGSSDEQAEEKENEVEENDEDAE